MDVSPRGHRRLRPERRRCSSLAPGPLRPGPTPRHGRWPWSPDRPESFRFLSNHAREQRAVTTENHRVPRLQSSPRRRQADPTDAGDNKLRRVGGSRAEATRDSTGGEQLRRRGRTPKPNRSGRGLVTAHTWQLIYTTVTSPPPIRCAATKEMYYYPLYKAFH